MPGDRQLENSLDMVQALLYLDNRRGERPFIQQGLICVAKGEPLTNPEYISERTKTSDAERINDMLRTMSDLENRSMSHDFFGYPAEHIDLHLRFLRR